MPQRFLRPDIRTSARWNETSFGAQSLYIGLMTLVDDFGRYDAREKLIYGEIFILRHDVKPQQTAAWLRELDKRDLIQLYDVDGKSCLQISRWKERCRSKTSRFPDPPLRNAAECCGILPPKSSPSPSPLVKRTPSGLAQHSAAHAGFESFWLSYPRKQSKPEAQKAWSKLKPSEFSNVLSGLDRWKHSTDWKRDNGQFIPHPSTFINQRRWEDIPLGTNTAIADQMRKLYDEERTG